MHLADLRRWLRLHDAEDAFPHRWEPARLAGYELAWNYRSIARRGGAANAMPRAGGELRGLALAGSERMLAALDAKEGHPGRYDRGRVPLTATLLADGSAVQAWLYRVAPAHELDVPVAPRAAYLQLLIEAAHEHDLGADYVRHVRASARRAKQ